MGWQYIGLRRETMAKRPGRRRCLVLTMSVVVALSSNCSLSRGRTQLVHVTSTPPDAQVLLNGGPVGETPVYVEVRRRDADPVLRIGKAGFESVESGLDRRLSGWFVGDLVGALLLGYLGWLIAALDYGGASPRSIGYGALWSAPVLVPPLALGTAFEFPNEIEVVLERADGGGDPVGASVGEPVRPLEVGSDLLRVHVGLANRAGADGRRLRERLRALRVGADGERGGPLVEAAPEGHR